MPPRTPAPPAPELVFLDVGDVLVDIRRDRAAEAWTAATGRPGDELAGLLFGDGRKQAFDRGQLTPEAFFAAAAAEADDPALAPTIARAYRAMIVPRRALGPLLRRLARHVRLGLLSNIDPVHYAVVAAEPAFAGLFDPTVLSFRTGARKPEEAAFRAALAAAAPLPAERLLLLDDRADNVAAARAMGMQAHLVPDEASVRAWSGGLGWAVVSG